VKLQADLLLNTFDFHGFMLGLVFSTGTCRRIFGGWVGSLRRNDWPYILRSEQFQPLAARSGEAIFSQPLCFIPLHESLRRSPLQKCRRGRRTRVHIHNQFLGRRLCLNQKIPQFSACMILGTLRAISQIVLYH
jgi:hypothetical protein